MSLFGALMGDFDDDLGLMNNHMNHHMNAMNMQMRSMNRLMNTFMPDPFNMLGASPFDPGFQQNALMDRNQQAMMPMGGGLFGFPAMPNFNRLLNADIGANNGASFCQSTVMTMSSGPDGRPQIYQASTSTKTGPGGVRETRKTVQDSRTGMKKMAIGHHIGERAHIIEKEQDLRSGQLEERQEFINLDEEEAEQFNREFTTRATRGVMPRGNGNHGMQAICAARPATSTVTIEPLDDDDDDDCVIQEPTRIGRQLPALPGQPTAQPPNSSDTDAAAIITTTTSPTRRAATTTATTTTSSPATSPTVYDLTNNNNNNYLGIGNSAAARRAYLRNGAHLATPRRPLRTPSSSPLATVSSASHSIAGSPSVNRHAYGANSAAARRQHRLKHHHQQQQQQHSQDSREVDQEDTEPRTKSAKRNKQ